MKKMLSVLWVALLMAGCGQSEEAVQEEAIDWDDPATRDKIIAEAIDWEKLQWRGEKGGKLYHASNQQKPYSGWTKGMHDDGQISSLLQFKDGKQDGPSTSWYRNGQKGGERTFMNDKLMTAVVWKPNGEKCPVTNVVNGNGVLVWYKDDGTEWSRGTYKDGERVDTTYPPY